MNKDTIYRQDAIEAILKKPAWHNSDGSYYHSSDIKDALEGLPSAQPYTADIQKIQDLEQAEIEKAFELGREDAMSEIIHCKDCKHRPTRDEGGWLDFPTSRCPCQNEDDFYYSWMPKDDWFCGNAERRTDD